MAYRTIEVVKSTPHIGAELYGIDLSKPLSDEQFEDVHAAMMQHLVIFFRDQKLSPERQKELGSRFGKLHIHPATPNVLPDHPEVFVIKADEGSKFVAGEDWHSDVSCETEPPMGTMLYLTTVPPDGGGDTLFANMYLALDTLSAPIRKLIDGMTAIHDGEPFYRGRYGNDDRGRAYPRAEHPVVRTHPVTGRKCLFVNRFFTTRLVGLSRNESDAILQMLFRHIETPEFSMRFRWQPGSVAFWDNRCAQHHALWDYYPHKRYGHRVTVCGDRPY
ncbi:MAG TPA: TauD/TfdA family dioxygenase [Hyphomicrobiaceae bacterium]|nr:TauD/TfdA family dioxygenase [Hyphomicrobiaceae bacterium]